MCKLLGDFATIWDNEEEFRFRRGRDFLCTTVPRQALGCALLPGEENTEKVKHVIINARISIRATVQNVLYAPGVQNFPKIRKRPPNFRHQTVDMK